MADKNQIDETYRFSEDFIRRTVEVCKDNAFFVNAYYEGKIISSQLNIQSDHFIHGHLLGNDYQYNGLSSNSLILYEICKWGVEKGKEALHIGGAFTESLRNYKMQYTKRAIYDFYIGTKVRNQQVYDQLIRIKGRENSNYFPAYR